MRTRQGRFPDRPSLDTLPGRCGRRAMSNTKKPHKKSLSQVVDEIEDNKEKALKYILFFRLAKREGIELSIEQPIAFNFERGFADYIINTLADMYLNLKIPPKKKAHPVPDFIFPIIKPEIEKIYEAIKKNDQ